MPLLLALMTRTLPGVIAQAGAFNPANTRAVRRLIDTADDLLLAHVEEFNHVSSTKRRRYWRCLLNAMIEDRVIAFRKPPPTSPS